MQELIPHPDMHMEYVVNPVQPLRPTTDVIKTVWSYGLFNRRELAFKPIG
ncbi:MAG: hypothetical protein ACT6FD_00220 [Methanosarcinaceae archaeon]